MRIAEKLIRTTMLTILSICMTQFAAFAAGTPIGEVVSMIGSVVAEQPDGTVRQLELNEQIITQDVIVTGIKSTVEILFKDESIYSQGPEARISLDDFVYSEGKSASRLLFSMGKGTFRYVTGQIVKTNPDAFALQTPTTTIGIRGTEVFAVVTPQKEEIGNTKLSKGHTMTVGNKSLDTPRTSVSVDPMTGAISDPAPVSQETINKVVKEAPMTSQGELGNADVSSKDIERKIESFKQQIERNKGSLGSLDDKPDYAKLHRLKVQTTSLETSERDRDSGDTTGDLGGGDGGGGGGGGGH